jgi:uncharacterized FlaG/YvyC family protein
MRQYSCIFDDILKLDFDKYKLNLEEHDEYSQHLKQQWEDEQREKEEQKEKVEGQEEEEKPKEVYKPEVDPRIEQVTHQLKILAESAEYAKNSKFWLQLITIFRYTCNVLAYNLTNPLELTQSDAWKYILIIAECNLVMLEQLQGGASIYNFGDT